MFRNPLFRYLEPYGIPNPKGPEGLKERGAFGFLAFQQLLFELSLVTDRALAVERLGLRGLGSRAAFHDPRSVQKRVHSAQLFHQRGLNIR